jgi:hypothetical protein
MDFKKCEKRSFDCKEGAKASDIRIYQFSNNGKPTRSYHMRRYHSLKVEGFLVKAGQGWSRLVKAGQGW